mmetsp:Transcript_17814/g.35569  ORF Transcript_17814/g.35569 Transcript_17814/m.35569 type:complete len:271 (-) Transcript_17814:2659-3471(-)
MNNLIVSAQTRCLSSIEISFCSPQYFCNCMRMLPPNSFITRYASTLFDFVCKYFRRIERDSTWFALSLSFSSAFLIRSTLDNRPKVSLIEELIISHSLHNPRLENCLTAACFSFSSTLVLAVLAFNKISAASFMFCGVFANLLQSRPTDRLNKALSFFPKLPSDSTDKPVKNNLAADCRQNTTTLSFAEDIPFKSMHPSWSSERTDRVQLARHVTSKLTSFISIFRSTKSPKKPQDCSTTSPDNNCLDLFLSSPISKERNNIFEEIDWAM